MIWNLAAIGLLLVVMGRLMWLARPPEVLRLRRALLSMPGGGSTPYEKRAIYVSVVGVAVLATLYGCWVAQFCHR